MGSSPSESHAGQVAQRHDQDRHRGVSDEACPPEIDFEALHRPIRTVLRDFVPSRGRQAGKGGWTPGFPPQAPPPAAQLTPIVRPVNSGPWPHGTSREGRLATNQSNASQDGSSNPQKEYSNFRRWQCFKPLARRHFRLSPDAEAFSCFLIPVLRSVDRLKPTMMQEERLRRAVQEWRRLSNLDRMIYYEMAEKFMEFAAEEEMHIQSLQWMQCAQDLPPPAPPKLDPRGPPAPKVHLQPGTQVPTGAEGTACAPRMSGPRAQPSHPKPHRSQRTPEPKAPKEIPPETLREYVDRMEALLVQKRLLDLKEDEGGPAAPSHSAPGMGSSPSESHAGQVAQRHDQDRHRGVSDEACPPEIDFEALHRPIRTVLRDFVPSRGRQAGKGGWTPGFPPQAPPPAAQLTPIVRPVNSGPWPHGTSREGRLATNQSNASQDGSSNPQKEYSNFRRWQCFKPLARRHFRLSPDAEAFSCFLIPVLRSVDRLKPTMMQEERLRRAVQEWRRLSNLDRMIYYEMAEKFMEFAAEEEMHIQSLQWMQCAQDLPPPAPPKLDPRGPPAPKVHLQPGTQVPTGAEGTACAPRMSGPRAQPSHPKPHRSQRTPEPKAPKEIPPETVREYVDRMEALVGPVHSARGKSHAECGKDGNELKQEEDDTYLDPCLLSYIDELHSREDSVTKVEAVIHPRFLAELFSPDPQLDLLLVQKRLLDLKEDEGGPAAPSHSAPGMGSSPSESHAGQVAQRHDQDRHRGVSDEACPPEIDFEALHRPIRTVLRDFVPSRGRQAGKGGWTPGFPPQAPPPAAQLTPIVRPVNSGPWPHGTSREGRLATNQSNASQDGSSNPQKEYSNFRRWQCFKPLARRHFRLSPDAEAFSCFLIPVLRSVDRLKPTMMQEERLRRAVQEWRRLSNLDRMIYYEMAEKFMEFAAEEEMHIQSLQWMQCAQDLPPPAPPKLDPRGPPAPKVHLQPGTQVPTGAEGTACAPRMSGPRAQPSHPKPHRSQRTPEPKAPKEIPPETVREYVDRMEALVGPVHSARGKSHAECGKDGNELKQEEDDTYLDPCLLSYIDELHSREDSVTKVEAVIHPRFLAELFSPDPQLDVLALAEELEQEEGLTPEELVQKRLLDLKEDEGGPAAPSHSAPGMGSSPSESHAGQVAQRHDQDRHRGVSDEACPPEIDFEALHRPIRTVLRDFVPSRGRQAGKGGWTPGFPPQAPPPAAQLTPIVRPVNSGPWPHGTSREGRLATNQSNASQDGSSNPQKEYSNFRRWQCFKPLARRHFRLSPDAEAFSCFLIPVLRSVDRLKPTMMQEERLRRAVQEWRRLSNLDRMIYYEMAEK
ncbi:uncharacterized protein AAG666_017552 [Megaptera novaeangliae]